MEPLSIPFYLFSRPLTSFARQTQNFCLRDQASRKASTRQACGGKNLNPAEAGYYQCLCLKGMKVLPGQIAQAKSFYCLRVSAVKIFTYLSHTTAIIHSFH
jgi:hypothetical protein